MKRNYRIGEIASLYGVGTDSLRYYEEIGLLKPTRGANGYRSYGIEDIWRLNIIRDMLRLDFSTRQIGEYLDDHTVDSTLKLLAREKAVVDRQIAQLAEIRRSLDEHIGEIGRNSRLKLETFELKKLPERKLACIGVGKVRFEGDFDVMIKKLQKRGGADRALMTRDTGAILPLSEIAKGIYDRYSTVFMIQAGGEDYDIAVPAGEFAVVRYSGAYSGTAKLMPELLEFADSRGRVPSGNALELYLIDIYETENEDEFVTEIQLPVKVGNRYSERTDRPI